MRLLVGHMSNARAAGSGFIELSFVAFSSSDPIHGSEITNGIG